MKYTKVKLKKEIEAILKVAQKELLSDEYLKATVTEINKSHPEVGGSAGINHRMKKLGATISLIWPIK